MLSTVAGFFNLGTGEIIIIVFAILLLFGGRKIPELMKGLGKGIRSFKQGMNDISDEINSPEPPKSGSDKGGEGSSAGKGD